ncbi:MAG TPA: CBS domain-containing protein [Polyangiaceae bacterium]|nr:CBS domain-containing protein [Polyangiaceae bacterium]
MQPIENTVEALMSRDVLCLSEDQDLAHIGEAMELFKFRHMPVTDDGKLVGLVSQRDLLRISASSLLPNAGEQTGFLTKQFRVRDIMTRDVQTVLPETSLVDAARLLHSQKVGCLPVVNAENAVVGILTDSDFVALAARLLELQSPGPL